MSDNGTPDLAQILTALQATNKSIAALTATVNEQRETIAQLQSKTPAVSEDKTSSPEIAKLQAAHDKLSEAYNKQLTEARAEKKNQSIRDGLLARGIDPKKAELAHTIVKDRVIHSKDGTFKFVDEQGAELPLDTGLDQFCESENGSLFKPTVPVQGAGMSAFSKSQNSNGYLAPNKPAGYVPLKNLGKTVLDQKDFAARIARTMGVNKPV